MIEKQKIWYFDAKIKVESEREITEEKAISEVLHLGNYYEGDGKIIDVVSVSNKREETK